MPDVIPTFGRCEECECGRHQRRDVFEGAWPRRTEKRFQLGKRLFNRIEVGTIRRQKPKRGARRPNRGEHLGLAVHREVIQDDHIAAVQGRHEDLLDVGEKTRVIDRPIEDSGRGEPLGPQRRHHGVGFPVAIGGVIVQAMAAQTPAIPPQEIGRHPTLVDEDPLAHVAQRQPRAPLPALSGDVRAPLFVGVYRFF